MSKDIRVSDWVTCGGFPQFGIVTSVSRDGTTAVVEWPTGTSKKPFRKKRMQVAKLTIQTTVSNGSVTMTDVTRAQELGHDVVESSGSNGRVCDE